MFGPQSHRWKTTQDYDVDAYVLTDRRWLLFAYVKSEKLAADLEFWKKLAAEFKAGEVVGVARALKTEKGSEPLPVVGQDVPAEVWTREGWVRYRLETANVLNPGLFLDQAYNRQRLIELVQEFISRSKGEFGESDGLLNLFSYTGSFSIAALCAGAKSTTSVDVSSRYLEWEKQNFEANFGGQEDLVQNRVISEDAREFVRRAAKRGSKYRWIILDPPTFSRGKGKPFKVRDDLAELAGQCLDCLVPGGALLVSCNDARWEEREFIREMEKLAHARKLRMVKGMTEPTFGPRHPLKSAWLLG